MSTFIIVVLTCIVAVLLAIQHLERRAHARAMSDLNAMGATERMRLLAEWRDERTELMNRVQHPQVFQARPSDVRAPVQTPQDEPSDLADLARVGTVIPGDFFSGDNGA